MTVNDSDFCRHDSGMTEGGRKLLCGLRKGHSLSTSPNEGGHIYRVSVPNKVQTGIERLADPTSGIDYDRQEQK